MSREEILELTSLLGVPVETIPNEVIVDILRGGATVARSAKCALLGGHTIRNPEPIYGLAVTGVIDPKRMLTNAAARPVMLRHFTQVAVARSIRVWKPWGDFNLSSWPRPGM
jgi:selenophosphate synthase